MGKLKYTFDKLQMIYDKGRYKAEWCAVDTENTFRIKNQVFVIDSSVIQYAVKNIPYYNGSSWNQWTNEAEMDRILYVVDDASTVTFYDENIDKIDSALIKKKK